MTSGSGSNDYGWLYESPEGDRAPSSRGGGGLPPPELPPPGSTPPPPRKKRRGRFRLLGLLVTAWLVFMLAVPIVAWSKVARVDADPGGERPGAQATTTYLLVGTDERPSDKSRGRTDTILLLTWGSGPSVLTSIPRDSLVNVPGHGRSKVNAAYAWGGAPLLVETLESATGLRIEGYSQIGFLGLVDVVDALGGIEVCPEKDMNDKDSKLDIRAGCQDVDGETALAYSRNRKSHSSGDIARGAAQREVIGGIGAEAASPMTFINPVRWARTATTSAESLAVGNDVSMFSFARFAWTLSRAMSGSGSNCTVPIRDMEVNWDEGRASEYFSRLANSTKDLGGLCTMDGLPA